MAHPFGTPSTETRAQMLARLGELEWSPKFLAQPDQTALTAKLHQFADSAEFAHYMSSEPIAEYAFRTWLQYNRVPR